MGYRGCAAQFYDFGVLAVSCDEGGAAGVDSFGSVICGFRLELIARFALGRGAFAVRVRPAHVAAGQERGANSGADMPCTPGVLCAGLAVLVGAAGLS